MIEVAATARVAVRGDLGGVVLHHRQQGGLLGGGRERDGAGGGGGDVALGCPAVEPGEGGEAGPGVVTDLQLCQTGRQLLHHSPLQLAQSVVGQVQPPQLRQLLQDGLQPGEGVVAEVEAGEAGQGGEGGAQPGDVVVRQVQSAQQPQVPGRS